jgi:hypothetical protein
MDCRVKPGNDDSLRSLRLAIVDVRVAVPR